MDFKRFFEGSKDGLPKVNDLGREMQSSCALVFGKKAYNQSENNCVNVVQQLAAKLGYAAPSYNQLEGMIYDYKGAKMWGGGTMPFMNRRSAAYMIVYEHKEDAGVYHVALEVRGREYNYSAADSHLFNVLMKIPLNRLR